MSQFPFVIRPLEARDIPDVISVERIVFKDPWPESAYLQELYFNPNAHYFVLLLRHGVLPPWVSRERLLARSGQVVGFIGLRIEQDVGHISTLAIRPEWQGRGLGEWLLITVLEQACKSAVRHVDLEVRVSNEIAQRLYEKYGFKSVSRLQRYYEDGEAAFLMRLEALDAAFWLELQARRAMLMTRLQAEMLDYG